MKYYKRLPFETIKNVRDLGGYPTLDGKMVSYGKVYRAANMDDLNEKDIEYLKSLNISTIIDLRREKEVETYHKKIDLVRENFDYKNISLASRNMRQEEIIRIINKEDSVGKSYYNLIDNYPAVKEIMEIIANAKGAVLFHCQEGKDRTGIISMIIYGLCNCYRSDIIADYEISAANLGYIERYDEDEDYSVFRITNPYNMKEAYNYIIRKYKSFEEYLTYAKVDKKTIEKIKEKMIE